ncbi:hypothetical protein [Candidatus Amarolinea dominans]|uniref:hypothetical protein n=1 Tax=Candidatus Amarolinea dominans TaxID=3140696 RepID=UPI003136A937|nr:hypothetical protein [Anaerolineae bacterium]
MGLLRLSEPWQVDAEAPPPTDPDWRQVAGEGIAALIKAGVDVSSPQKPRGRLPEASPRRARSLGLTQILVFPVFSGAAFDGC